MSNSPRKIKAISWLLIALLAIGQPAFAADQFGQVMFNGVPVPGATVTASQGEKKVAATSDAEGIFRLVDLAEGVWTLTVEMLGFAPVTREVTVPTKEDPPPFELTLKSFEQISRELPVQRQEAVPQTAAAPTAAAQQQARGPAASGTPAAAQPGFQRAGVNQANTAPPARQVAALPDSAPPDPSGAADGLLINGSVNNGASTPFAQPRAFGNARPNQRSLYTYAAGITLGSSSLDARPFSITGQQTARPSYTDAQGLGSFQGPVRIPRLLRNPINIFVGYQGTSDTNTTTAAGRVPTDLERLGDFSQTTANGQPVRLIDPTTGLPFSGNQIPAGRISPQAASLLQYYPRADGTSGGQNYQAPIVSKTRQDSVQSRLAYTINNRNGLNGTLNFQRNVTDSSTLLRFDNTREFDGLDTQVTWNYRISPFMNMTTRYQFTRLGNESIPYFANRVNVSGEAGILGNAQDPLNWGPPTLSFANEILSLSDSRYNSTTTKTHIWASQMSRFSGRHNMTFGGEVRKTLNDVVGHQDPRGSFAFTGAATGSAFADFLLGLPQTSAIAFGNADKYFRGEQYAAFFTDDYRVSPSLTLNLGVRWEYETPITEAQDRLVNLDVAPGFGSVAPVIAGQSGAVTGEEYSNALLEPDKGGFQPRLALAWRPVPGSSLVVRAGYGLYRSLNVYQSIATLLAQQPPLSTSFNVATTAANPLTLANGFQPVGNRGINTFAVDPGFRPSTAQNWQASVQRDLPFSLTVAATYLGAKGTNLMQQILPNTVAPGAINSCAACPTGFRYLMSGGRSIRHAGQVQLRRRLRNGFTSSIQYTLAKAMDNAGAFGGASLDGGALAQNWQDLEAEYARSSFDQRHLINVTAEYTTGAGITGGALLDGWKGRLLKDWTMTANLTTGSGNPLTPVYFSPVAGIIGSLRPSLTGISEEPADGLYANRAAYAPPAPGQWGDAKRNSITGPSTFSLNGSVARTFRLGDRINMDWTVTMTNLLNRLVYTRINTIITSDEFGLPNGTNDQRKVRTTVRLRF